MSLALKKLFYQDESPFQDGILRPLNKLFQSKKGKVSNFYSELMDLRDLQGISIDTIFDE